MAALALVLPTTPTAAAAEIAPNAHHDDGECARWAAHGECESNPAFMRQSCAGACASTRASSTATVAVAASSRTDAHHDEGECMRWASNGECRANPAFMRSLCAASCTPPSATCERLSVDAAVAMGLEHIVAPTIVTNVLAASDPTQWANWSKPAMLREFGHFVLDRADLRFNGAGREIVTRDQERLGVTLNDIVHHRPALSGNLFVPGWTQASDDDVPSLNSLWWELLPQKLALPNGLKELLAPIGSARHASIGQTGQWNEMHNHPVAVFTLVRGRKGWLLAPPHSRSRLREAGLLPTDEMLEKGHVVSSGDAHALLCGLFDAPEPNRSRLDELGGTACTLEEGESLVVPSHWFHGTCGLHEWNVGFTYIGFDASMEDVFPVVQSRARLETTVQQLTQILGENDPHVRKYAKLLRKKKIT